MPYFLKRMILIPMGYMLAISAAASVLVATRWAPFLAQSTNPQDLDMTLLAMDSALVFWAAGTVAFLPAAAAILLTEILHLRSWIAHILLGAAVSLIAGQVLGLFGTGHETIAPFFDIPAILRTTLINTLAAGFAGGLMYWLVAGRNKKPAVSTPIASPHP